MKYPQHWLKAVDRFGTPEQLLDALYEADALQPFPSQKEYWISEGYIEGKLSIDVYRTEAEAKRDADCLDNARVIHVKEVENEA